MLDTGLENPLLANGLASFDPSNIDYNALQDINSPGFGDENRDGIPDHWNQEAAPLHTNHRGYIGEDGQIYRKELTWNKVTEEFEREYTDERLYFWTPPAELGDSGLNGDQEAAMAGPKGFGAAGLYTEAEIKAAWDAKEGMGYLKQHTTWDKYWNFIEQSTALFTDSEYNDMTGGNMSTGNWQDSPEYMALLEETGIPTQYINDDGDVFNFNGTTYVKDYKVDDSIGVDVINSMALGLIGGFVAGPILATALGPTLGVAGAKAASASIVSMASQYMVNGEVDFTQALISAATVYGGAKLGEALQGSGALGEIGEKISGVTDKFTEALDKTGDIASAAIKAGGMSLLTQMVTTGEIDVTQAGLAALLSGGATAFQEWTTYMYGAGVAPDEYMQDLAEMEEFQQAAIDADIKDPFLNPNYKTVGDGLVMNVNTNQVYGVTDDKNHGTMKDLDLDGDGQLSGNDLANINTPDRNTVNPDLNADNLSYAGTHPVTEIAYDENGKPYVDRREVFWKEGDNQNLYYEDGTVAATNNGDDTWTFGDDSNAPTGKLSEFGFEADSGPINFEQQADSARLPDTEQVIYDPETNSFKGTGTPGDQGIATPIGDQDHDYWLVRDENGQIFVTDGLMMEPYKGGYTDEDWLQGGEYNDHLINMFRNKDPIWQHVRNGGALPQGVNPNTVFADIVVPETPTTKPEKPANSGDGNAPDGDPNNSTNGGGNSTSTATNAGAGNAGTQGADAPKPADSYSDPFLQAIAATTNNSVDAVVDRINNGESPSQIVNDPSGANVVQTTDGDTTVTPATNTGGGDNSGSSSSGDPNGEEEDTPKDGDPCTTSDGRKGVIQDGACVFQPTVLGVDPSVWADDGNTTGGNTDSNNSGGDNNGNNSGNTTTNAATPAPGNPGSGTSPGILVVADDVWGTGSSGDGNTGTGDGTGEGEGDGEGEGGGGNGGNGGNGGVAKSGRGGSNTQWSPLYAGTKFRRFDKRARQGMMQMAQTPNFTAQDNSQLRMGLLSSIAKDLA